jgi:hypothetical protein
MLRGKINKEKTLKMFGAEYKRNTKRLTRACPTTLREQRQGSRQEAVRPERDAPDLFRPGPVPRQRFTFRARVVVTSRVASHIIPSPAALLDSSPSSSSGSGSPV